MTNSNKNTNTNWFSFSRFITTCLQQWWTCFSVCDSGGRGTKLAILRDLVTVEFHRHGHRVNDRQRSRCFVRQWAGKHLQTLETAWQRPLRARPKCQYSRALNRHHTGTYQINSHSRSHYQLISDHFLKFYKLWLFHWRRPRQYTENNLLITINFNYFVSLNKIVQSQIYLFQYRRFIGGNMTVKSSLFHSR